LALLRPAEVITVIKIDWGKGIRSPGGVEKN